MSTATTERPQGEEIAELPALTLVEMLREHARARPDEVALRQKRFGIWRPTSWAEYWRRARHVALGLHALGLGRGGHLGILSENRIEWVLGQMGAGVLGAVTVGVYPTSPSNEVAYVHAVHPVRERELRADAAHLRWGEQAGDEMAGPPPRSESGPTASQQTD